MQARHGLLVVLVLVALSVAGPLAGQTIVVDDEDPACDLKGVWADSKSAGWSGAAMVGGGYRYTSVHPPARKTGNEKAIYTPRLPRAGRYQVELTYRVTDNRSSRVVYEVRHKEGKRRFTLNQREEVPGNWKDLGVFSFDAGKEGSVAFVSDGGGSGAVDAARFTFKGEGGGQGNLDNVVNPPGGSGSTTSTTGTEATSATTAGHVRIGHRHPGRKSYVFPCDGKARLEAYLSTYGAAHLRVTVVRADGSKERFMTWKRTDGLDPSPLEVEGKPVEESMFEQSPGDYSAKPVHRVLKGQKGDQVILEMEGDFGRAEPYLELKGPAAP